MSGTVGPTGAIDAAAVVAELREWFGERFAHLTALGEVLTQGLTTDLQGRLELGHSARRGMKGAAHRFLGEHPVVDGCGLIFAHSALGTEAGLLEWWVREDETRFARYSFGMVPGADRYYDYEQHEWFVRAFSEGRAAAVGPYIDYLGVEVYLITLTVPALVHGERVGAVGNDIQLDDLERALLPVLSKCSREIALVNRYGNVLVSNSARFLPGECITSPPERSVFEDLHTESADLRVLIGEQQP